ncbi:MAG: DUF1273 domain-containing protein [Oscillospiraceae bacterium]|nr:DUF1273 domain-containing protein [Oscillospiraceae bacterium]
MREREVCCAFSGHRPHKLPENGDEKSNQIMMCKHFLFGEIDRAIAHGYREFLCGMAMGTDLWCAEIVLSLRRNNPQISLHAVLPWRTQASAWPPEWQRRYRAALEQADEITQLSEHYYKGCFLLRNRFLVEHASRLIALCIGGQGGTGATLRLAREAGLEVFCYDPTLLWQMQL